MPTHPPPAPPPGEDLSTTLRWQLDDYAVLYAAHGPCDPTTGEWGPLLDTLRAWRQSHPEFVALCLWALRRPVAASAATGPVAAYAAHLTPGALGAALEPYLACRAGAG